MGHRLSKIYTRTGDTGQTGLGDGSRVAKDSLRIEAIGAVDELNSCLGVLLCEPIGGDVGDLLTGIQHILFELGGELSIPGHDRIQAQHVTRLERALDHHNASLAPLKEFISAGRQPPGRPLPPGALRVPQSRAPRHRARIQRAVCHRTVFNT